MQIHTLFARKKYARAVATGAVALAASGVILLRAERNGHSAGGTAHIPSRIDGHVNTVGGAPSAEFRGPFAHGRIALAQGAVAATGEQHVLAEIRLSADPVAAATANRPVAMAVVLDISGSMSGAKIEQAKTSVLQLVERMRDTDQIALITYSDTARVVQPLAPLSLVRAQLRVTIPTIGIEGGTNIPAGLAMGALALASAAENSGLVRRIVLVSDGQDTSGRHISEIKTEVRQRADQGVTVSTLGIGTDYSETYMTAIADSGRGNYEFLRTGAELANFLQRELQQSNNTTVERAVATVTLPAGWRLARAIGVESQTQSGVLTLPIGSLFAGDERRVVLDLIAPQSVPGTGHDILFRAQWQAVRTSQDVRVGEGHLAVRTVATDAEAMASRDMTVYAESESAVLALRQRDAIEQWRSGNVQGAQQLAADNIVALNRLQAAAPTAAPMLMRQAAQYNSENAAFGSMSAGSEAGRAFGLSSNARHRGAAMRANAY